MTRPVDFDLKALYLALDAERRSRGMSWHQAARDISAAFRDTPAAPLSASTLTGLRERSVAEGDGVLQMLRWLDRSPESFIAGHEGGAALPAVGLDQILRFDTQRLHAAVDARRTERGMTWKEVASEIPGFSAASLARLSKGGRTSFPHVARIAMWLGVPLAAFTRAASR